MGWSLQQHIFTPEESSNPEFFPADRPYAGWLNLNFSIVALKDNHLTRLHFGAGLVGETSLAEVSQNLSHELMGSTEPIGWDMQLQNEPTFLIAYDRKWRVAQRLFEAGLYSDWAPSVGVALSNAITQVEVGLSWRFGKNIPADFYPPRVTAVPNDAAYFRSSASTGWYLFVGVNVRYVPYNLFLDGSLFRDSPSVDSEMFVGEAFTGFVYYLHDLRFSYVFVERSKEFETQDEGQSLGAITLTWSM